MLVALAQLLTLLPWFARLALVGPLGRRLVPRRRPGRRLVLTGLTRRRVPRKPLAGRQVLDSGSRLPRRLHRVWLDGGRCPVRRSSKGARGGSPGGVGVGPFPRRPDGVLIGDGELRLPLGLADGLGDLRGRRTGEPVGHVVVDVARA